MKRTKVLIFILFILIGSLSFAQNPILRERDPGFLYACDPSAEVFDGQAYIYGNDHWVDIGEPGRYMMGANLKHFGLR